MLNYVHIFLYSLVFSVSIESVAAVSLYYFFKKIEYRIIRNRDTESESISIPKLIVAASLGTMCTIPYVWFVFPTLLWDKANYIVVVGESVAVIVESLFYYYYAKLSWKYAFLFSLLANLTSYAIGQIF